MFKRIMKIGLLIVGLLIVLCVIGVFWLKSLDNQELFDFVYKHPLGIFDKNPNALLVETVSNITPGKALDVAMGEGRNAVWLATNGWDVTGFDISEEGLRQANEKAEKAGVKINAVLAASENFDYGNERWDLIVLSYAWTPIPDAEYVTLLRNSLKPGGLIVFEHVLNTSSGKIPGATRAGEAKKIFNDFNILSCEELTTRSDWGWEEKQPIVRVVARR